MSNFIWLVIELSLQTNYSIVFATWLEKYLDDSDLKGWWLNKYDSATSLSAIHTKYLLLKLMI